MRVTGPAIQGKRLPTSLLYMGIPSAHPGQMFLLLLPKLSYGQGALSHISCLAHCAGDLEKSGPPARLALQNEEDTRGEPPLPHFYRMGEAHLKTELRISQAESIKQVNSKSLQGPAVSALSSPPWVKIVRLVYFFRSPSIFFLTSCTVVLIRPIFEIRLSRPSKNVTLTRCVPA